jgi:hypothetical protein
MTNKLAEHFAFLDALAREWDDLQQIQRCRAFGVGLGLDPTDARRVHAAWMQARASR